MKLLRIETRSGQIRIVGLAPFPDLPAWISTMRRDGWCIGDIWAMPFDEIALIDVIDVPDQPAAKPEAPADSNVHNLAAAISFSHFKSPFES